MAGSIYEAVYLECEIVFTVLVNKQILRNTNSSSHDDSAKHKSKTSLTVIKETHLFIHNFNDYITSNELS